MRSSKRTCTMCSQQSLSIVFDWLLMQRKGVCQNTFFTICPVGSDGIMYQQFPIFLRGLIRQSTVLVCAWKTVAVQPAA